MCAFVFPTISYAIRLIRHVFIILLQFITVRVNQMNIFMYVIISYISLSLSSKLDYFKQSCSSIVWMYVTYVVHIICFFCCYLMLMSRNVCSPCLIDIITFHFINIFSLFLSHIALVIYVHHRECAPPKSERSICKSFAKINRLQEEQTRSTC